VSVAFLAGGSRTAHAQGTTEEWPAMTEQSGRALAAVVVAPGAGASRRVLGELVTVRVLADQTGGAYSLLEVRTAPGGGAPPHRQLYEDEAWFVLEGTYVLALGRERIELGPGGYAFVPRGTLHAYRNAGATPARMLVLLSPGGVQERFVAEVGASPGAPAPMPAADLAAAAVAGEKYGLEFLPEPGAPA
jgi:quercetin dioxygenase-like cupin family protein